jgi:hypothetical protein
MRYGVPVDSDAVFADWRTCRVCQEEKPPGDFYRHATSSTGKRGECKLCTTDQTALNRAKRAAANPPVPRRPPIDMDAIKQKYGLDLARIAERAANREARHAAAKARRDAGIVTIPKGMTAEQNAALKASIKARRDARKAAWTAAHGQAGEKVRQLRTQHIDSANYGGGKRLASIFAALGV